MHLLRERVTRPVSSSTERRSRGLAFGLATAALCAYPLLGADPPPAPPCDIVIQDIFCYRVTDVRGIGSDSDRFKFEFEIVNWTGSDVARMTIALNVGGNPDPCNMANGGCLPSPGQNCAPFISGAEIDGNGRPLGAGSLPPTGNVPASSSNGWSVVGQDCSFVDFAAPAGDPIPHRSATTGITTYDGLDDPDFDNCSISITDRAQALLAMIPGSTIAGGSGTPNDPLIIDVPIRETADDAEHALDGFVVEIDDLDVGEQFSLNWTLFRADGTPIGYLELPFGGGTPVMMGDSYGFGALNYTRLRTFLNDPTTTTAAPAPLFTVNTSDPTRVNTGYDPADNSDPDQDKASNWAEEEIPDTTDPTLPMDSYPINPIPALSPFDGSPMPNFNAMFAIEPGAAITANFRLMSDANLAPGICSGSDFFEVDVPLDSLSGCGGTIHIGAGPVCPAPPSTCGSSCVCDDGVADDAMGLPDGGALGLLHYVECFQSISAVEAAYGSPLYPGAVDGRAVRVFVWEDTDGDRDPRTGLVLRHELQTTVQNANTDVFNTYQISPPAIVGGRGFIGVVIDSQPGDYPAARDASSGHRPDVWAVASSTLTMFDADDLTNNLLLPPIQMENAPCDTIWLLRAIEGPVGTPICFGDGTATTCPCVNNGGPGEGCANGTGAGGILTASGTASVSNDTMSLTANGVINNNGLFFQGNNTIGGGAGTLFGDGIRCCGGGVVRIQVVNPPGTTSPATALMTETATTNGPAGTITAGTKKCYQYWYRDPATSPCGTQFNLTHAVTVTWHP